MTREHAGHYSQKHPGDTLDPGLARAVSERAREGRLACAAAFALAKELSLSPAEVGRTLDLLELKISRCQLGLFGYNPGYNKPKPAQSVEPELEEAIRRELVNGRLPCAAAWQLAGQRGLARLEVTSACNKLGLKISQCQLGAF